MRRLFVTIAAATLLSSCGGDRRPDSGAAQQPGRGADVLATFYPLQHFAERIAGGKVQVSCPLPAGEDPIFWQPDKASIAAYQAAELIVINGADFEKWLGTVSLPENRIVNTAKSFEQDFIRFEGSTTHRHGDGEEHTHEGIDGHTWLDPINAKVQAAAIHRALAKRWPEHAAEFEANFENLVADLDSLDAEFRGLAVDQELLASHPAYNYLARRYGWQVTSLDLDPEIMPAKDAVPADHPAKVILWESQPRDLIISLLEREHGLESIVFSPVETAGADDYFTTMRRNIATLANALAGAE